MMRSIKEKENIRLLNTMMKFNVNSIIFHASNTYEHEMAKAKICYYLKKNGRNFICEATFVNGCRADIFDITWGIALEVLHTEKEENIDIKREKYPVFVNPVSATEILECDFAQLDKYLN